MKNRKKITMKLNKALVAALVVGVVASSPLSLIANASEQKLRTAIMNNATAEHESLWTEWSIVTASSGFGVGADTTGKQVKHKGKIYQSKWWTTGEYDKEPGSDESYNTGWDEVGIIGADGTVTLNSGILPNPYKVSDEDVPSDQPYDRIDAGKGKKWGDKVFAPYVDIGLWYNEESTTGYTGLYNLSREAEKSGIEYANLGFIVSDSTQDEGQGDDYKKNATFGGAYNVDGTGVSGGSITKLTKQIKEFREKGGDVLVSFGGENGTPLHAVYDNAEELADKYIEIIEHYGLTTIDFDIEGAHVRDKEAWERNNQAVKIVQDKMGADAPDVWYTFPVLPTGLVGEGTDNDSYNVMTDAVEKGINVKGVNIMTMCFGPAFVEGPTDEYYKYVVAASESLKAQIQAIYKKAGKELTDAEAYKKIGLTPWAGKSTQPNETFIQSDARELLKYANEKNIGMLSFWSINRDNDIAEDLKNTGIEQEEYEFSKILDSFDGNSTEVPDTKPTIKGATDKTINQDDTFDKMAGVTAEDKEDGNLTSKVKVTGEVETSKPGTYTLTYSVTDLANQTSTVTRKVTVKEVASETTITPNEFVMYNDSYLTGKFTGDVAKIKVVVDGEQGGTYAGGTIGNGEFEFYAKNKIHNSYDKVTINAYDAEGTQVASKEVSLKNPDGAGKVAVNDYILHQSKYVEGTFEGNVSKVQLQVGDEVYNPTAVTAGQISYYAHGKIKNTTDKVILIGLDKRGHKIDQQEVKVTDTVSDTITPNEFVMYNDSYLTGKFTGDIAKIKVVVDGEEGGTYSGGTIENAEFEFYAKNKIHNSYDKVTINAYNAEGAQVASKEVSLKNPDGAGKVAVNDYILHQSKYVEGTFEGNVSKVQLQVGEETYNPVAATNNEFSIYAHGKIKNTTDKVTLIALDKRGHKIDQREVKVTENQNTAPRIAGATDKTINKGSTFDKLAGVTATDKEDGDLTATIKVTGDVNTSKPGEYKLVYSVKDSAGKETKVTRTIIVKDVIVPVDPAAEMVNPEDDVLVGYWHNWPAGNKDGYQGGSSAAMDLTDIRKEYNVIDASFMKSVGNGTIPTFKPYNMTDEEFRAQIGELNQDGRSVLMALGGADAHIELKNEDKEAFKAEIIRMVDTYGFDGLDIDLEQSAITAGDNETVIPEVLREVKDHYKAQGKNFLITMAPEFPYLKPGAAYEAYIKGLDGYYDWINPQLYNQGGDGLWIDELNLWLTQNNDEMKEEFLYYMADSLSHGTRDYLQIPADKLVLGLPTNIDAAATGYVIDPADVKGAMDRLKADGNPIKGLMTWSVNWDAGKDKAGKEYNWEFVNRYAPMLFGDAKK